MGQLMHERLRLGKIGYLNVLPIYHPLESGIIAHPFEIISGAPAQLNRLMALGDLEVSVVSSIEYARNPGRYFVLPDLSISCGGPVGSVVLLSRVPIERLDGETILASTQSHTSVALLHVLFQLHLNLEARVLPGNCTEALRGENPPTAFLAIGDEALRLLRDRRDFPFRLDLGEAWRSWTGLPFVFALWVIQRTAIERWNGALLDAIRVLGAAREWGSRNLGLISTLAAQKGPLTREEAEEYYQGLRFDLDGDAREGLMLFFRMLSQTGEILKVPPLELCSPLESVA
ncbi:MAG: menaquinone biosynthesis protein [Syntrophobacteraceae bacterium]|nr:menaquinone biosynthesis protein [Syntrophobacteraceae bacterium]